MQTTFCAFFLNKFQNNLFGSNYYKYKYLIRETYISIFQYFFLPKFPESFQHILIFAYELLSLHILVQMNRYILFPLDSRCFFCVISELTFKITYEFFLYSKTISKLTYIISEFSYQFSKKICPDKNAGTYCICASPYTIVSKELNSKRNLKINDSSC